MDRYNLRTQPFFKERVLCKLVEQTPGFSLALSNFYHVSRDLLEDRLQLKWPSGLIYDTIKQFQLICIGLYEFLKKYLFAETNALISLGCEDTDFELYELWVMSGVVDQKLEKVLPSNSGGELGYSHYCFTDAGLAWLPFVFESDEQLLWLLLIKEFELVVI